MKRMTKLLFILPIMMLMGLTNAAKAQGIKVNIPVTIVGTPNIGYEQTLGQQLSLSGDVLWAPYLFKKNEDVFRALIGTIELRYYVKPKFYYTNNTFDGFYIGPYAMLGNFNVGFQKKGDVEFEKSRRYVGWGLSGGVSLGYKFYLMRSLRLDINLGLGYAQMQYDTYKLGGENAQYPLAFKDTRVWIGPTKFGVNLVYNIF